MKGCLDFYCAVLLLPCKSEYKDHQTFESSTPKIFVLAESCELAARLTPPVLG